MYTVIEDLYRIVVSENLDELDSYMYQTVGHQGIEMIAEAMELPLFRQSTKGKALEKGRIYNKTENDEVEDLYELLETVKVNYQF